MSYLANRLRVLCASPTFRRMSGKVLRDFEPYANERGYKLSVTTLNGGHAGSISPKATYLVAIV